MRFVPIKTAEQQTVLTVHRTRDLLIGQRTQSSAHYGRIWSNSVLFANQAVMA
jgi:transposase